MGSNFFFLVTRENWKSMKIENIRIRYYQIFFFFFRKKKVPLKAISTLTKILEWEKGVGRQGRGREIGGEERRKPFYQESRRGNEQVLHAIPNNITYITFMKHVLLNHAFQRWIYTLYGLVVFKLEIFNILFYFIFYINIILLYL